MCVKQTIEVYSKHLNLPRWDNLIGVLKTTCILHYLITWLEIDS